MKNILTGLIGLLLVTAIAAQENPVQLHFSAERKNDSIVNFVVEGKIIKGVRLFDFTTNEKAEGFFSLIKIKLDSIGLVSNKAIESFNLTKEKDKTTGLDVAFYTDSVHWEIPVFLAKTASQTLSGTVNQLLSQGDSFPTKQEDFTVTVKGNTGKEDITNNKKEEKKYGSIWAVFFAGLGAGLVALIFPCIYALIPVTVSFFLKRSKTKRQGIANAITYSLSIILIFAIIGFIFGLTRNAGFANDFASSAVFNIFVFTLFLVFGISFLGAFEITLPSSWTNSIDSKADNKSIIGIFFMALTLVVVSFSCTAPFISYFAVTPGLTLAERTIAFAGFGLGIALPFTLFALSPSLLNKLAKGGGWLNSLKVCFGFIELAFALKFLSSADLSYHWRLLDREVYLSLWIAIFGLLSLYLLGKIKLHHDDELPKNDYGIPYLTVTRLFFALAALAFTVYMIPGLWGAPLKGISAWLPEEHTQDFNLHVQKNQQVNSLGQQFQNNSSNKRKYADFLGSEIPGVESFFDYDEALAEAKKMHKPLMIDFTGHACANCRKMEKEVLSNAGVMKTLQNDFVVVSLYVDDKFKLPENEWTKSAFDSTNILKRMGDKNLEFEVKLSNNNAQPFYLFVDSDGVLLVKDGYGYESNIQKFQAHLNKVLIEFKKKNS